MLEAHRRGRILVAVGLFTLTSALAACSEVTAPQGDAEIVFRLDQSSCQGTAMFELFIDGSHAGSRELSPGDSATFPVPPGEHSAGATTATTDGYAIWFPQVVTLAPKQRYVQTLRC